MLDLKIINGTCFIGGKFEKQDIGIKRGKIVISDRYADSTFVYQGYVNKFGVKKAKALHKELLNNFYPDYTFIFNLNIKEIINRLKKRKIKINPTKHVKYVTKNQLFKNRKKSLKKKKSYLNSE